MGQNIISDAACSTTAERLWWLTVPKCLCVHVTSCHVMTNAYHYLFQLQNCVIVQYEKVRLCKMKYICITHTHMEVAAISKILVPMRQATW